MEGGGEGFGVRVEEMAVERGGCVWGAWGRAESAAEPQPLLRWQADTYTST